MKTYNEANGHGICPHVKCTIYLFSVYTRFCYEKKEVIYVIRCTNFHVKGIDNNFSLMWCLNRNLLGLHIAHTEKVRNTYLPTGHRHNRMAEIINRQRFKPISPQFLVQCSTNWAIWNVFSRVNAKVSFAGKRKFGERKIVSTRSVEHASGAGRQTSLACYIPRVAS